MIPVYLKLPFLSCRGGGGGRYGGAVVTALASHQCGPGSNPGVEAICGLSFLLVLSCAPKRFSPGTPFFPLSSKANIFKFQFRRGILAEEQLCACAISKRRYLRMYLFLSFSFCGYFKKYKMQTFM